MQALLDFKIFGERNTFTNSLRQIVELNSRNRCFPFTGKELHLDVAGHIRRVQYRSRAAVEAEIDGVFAHCRDWESLKDCATNLQDAA
jgi:hypothetical protein